MTTTTRNWILRAHARLKAVFGASLLAPVNVVLPLGCTYLKRLLAAFGER